MQPKITNQCPANWDEMQPNSNGKHCITCCKTVVDFTKMTNTEILQYFERAANQKTCGHFYAYQLDDTVSKLNRTLLDLNLKASNHKNRIYRGMLLFFVSILFLVTGCTVGVNDKKGELIGDTIGPSQQPIPPQRDSFNQ